MHLNRFLKTLMMWINYFLANNLLLKSCWKPFLVLLQVAERSLFLWNNDHIENLIKQNRNVILPIIFPALERNAESHWNQAVQSLTLNVRKIFSDHDPELFAECLKKFEEDEAKENEIKSKREATWKRLEEIATSKAGSNEAVLLPRIMPHQVSSRWYHVNLVAQYTRSFDWIYDIGNGYIHYSWIVAHPLLLDCLGCQVLGDPLTLYTVKLVYRRCERCETTQVSRTSWNCPTAAVEQNATHHQFRHSAWYARVFIFQISRCLLYLPFRLWLWFARIFIRAVLICWWLSFFQKLMVDEWNFFLHESWIHLFSLLSLFSFFFYAKWIRNTSFLDLNSFELLFYRKSGQIMYMEARKFILLCYFGSVIPAIWCKLSASS